MIKKRNLLKDIVLNEKDDICGPIKVDVQKIKYKVGNAIDSPETERKSNHMKSRKKMFAIAAAAVLALGITAFATSGIVTMWYASSSSTPDYTSLPKAEQVVKDIGYEPVLIDTFENGYTFYEGSIVENSFAGEDGKTMEKFKSVMLRYKKDGDKVLFSQEKFSSQLENEGDVYTVIDGTHIYYNSYTNKIVPPDYKMTEEDKKAEASGELVFSWGSDEVSISKVQSVSWVKDGLHHSLLQIDGKLSADELVKMADEALK